MLWRRAQGVERGVVCGLCRVVRESLTENVTPERSEEVSHAVVLNC